jgi:DtxR family Mn-dependent transcriptional regulator
MASERTEDYLKAIYERQVTESPVPISALAKDLKVSARIITNMLRKLEASGLIEYKAGKGASLTTEGAKVAASAIRRHRLWERFLTDVLGIRWDKVHDQAHHLEHATSPYMEMRLSSLLGNPDTCPHGHPIPDRKGKVKDQGTIPLSEFEPLQKAYIVAVSREDAKLLRSIAKLGLRPPAVIQIEGKNSDGSIELKLDAEKVLLTKEVASSLLAKPVPLEEQITITEEVPISRLINGGTGTVKSFTVGRNILRRCLSMGFAPGSTVVMLENFGSGPVLVKIHDMEVALGRGIAEKIIVTRKRVV